MKSSYRRGNFSLKSSEGGQSFSLSSMGSSVAWSTSRWRTSSKPTQNCLAGMLGRMSPLLQSTRSTSSEPGSRRGGGGGTLAFHPLTLSPPPPSSYHLPLPLHHLHLKYTPTNLTVHLPHPHLLTPPLTPTHSPTHTCSLPHSHPLTPPLTPAHSLTHTCSPPNFPHSPHTPFHLPPPNQPKSLLKAWGIHRCWDRQSCTLEITTGWGWGQGHMIPSGHMQAT